MNAQRGDVGIVLDEHRDAQMLFNSFLGASFQPSRFGAKMTEPALKSTAPGAPRTDARDLFHAQVGFVDRIPRSGHTFDHRLDTALVLGAQLAVDRFEGTVKNTREDLRSAEITPITYSALLLGSGISRATRRDRFERLHPAQANNQSIKPEVTFQQRLRVFARLHNADLFLGTRR